MSLHDEKPEQVETENFDFGLKKKKKKKAVPDFEEVAAAETETAAPEGSNGADAGEGDEDAVAEGDDAGNMFADLKKKKKKKKVTLEDEEPAQEEGAEGTKSEAFDFGEKKKRRKRRPDLAEFEAQLREGQTGDDGEEEEGTETSGAKKEGDDTWQGSSRDYTYNELLSRVFKILRQNNPELVGDKKRYTIAPPQVMKEGTKKSVFANVVDICKRMHRQPDHVIQYLFAELGTTGSIDGSQRLVIKGRFQQKQIENVLKRYFMEYVTCKTCKSADTILTKENRLFFLQCESCGSTRTVSAIKTGFMAQTRDARKAARANA
ncbi:hypothetical protein SpCBS45565_g01310 [Spizellomyces sp. 'palustris']|nr:hypothetical protein SpCBS45565_g01310 [Spizellomyces sp. 'palustris']